MTEKLGFDFTPDLMQMGDMQQISEALVQTALEQGKSEAEISNAMS